MSASGSRQPLDAETKRPSSPRRVATLYDAVAGRAGYESFLGEERTSKNRDTKTTSSQAVYPEEVLFRRKGAPLRFEETDTYFAHEKLDATTQKLPDSDLLKALHAYASTFYARAVPKRGKIDFRSMDETALLAMGILLEETVAHQLGETGDLAFVEGSDADQGLSGPAIWDGRAYRRSVIRRRSSTAGREPRKRHRESESSPIGGAPGNDNDL